MTDEHELSTMVRERIGALTGYAYLLCGSVKEAEDLVQDAFVKVFSRRRAPDAATSESYVRRAILTIYLDQYRRRRRWSGIKHLVGVADRQESAELATSAQLDVAVALDALTPRQRACVVLRYYDDLTVPQVAQSLGCAPGTVKRHLSDAHQALRTILGEDVDLPEDSPGTHSTSPPGVNSTSPPGVPRPVGADQTDGADRTGRADRTGGADRSGVGDRPGLGAGEHARFAPRTTAAPDPDRAPATRPSPTTRTRQ